MDLDRRAARARDALQSHVAASVDVDLARGRLDAVGRRRRADVRQARAAALALLAVAALAGVLVVRAGGLASPDGTGGRQVADGTGRDRRERKLLEQLPASPIDGKDSWRLPVLVDPQSGVHDGQVIRLYGRGFEPHEQLGIVQCTSEADTLNSGIDACDLGTNGSYDHVQYATATADGTVVANVTVRRFIETPGQGRVDCASAAERCLVGVGAIANYDRSGGTYVQFDGAPDFEEPTMALDPQGRLTPGGTVDVTIERWAASRRLRLQQCRDDRCQNLLDARAGADGRFTASVALNAAVVVDGVEVPCDDRCVLRATGIGLPGQSVQPFPPDAALRFDDPAAGATTTSRPPATTLVPPPVPSTAAPGAATTAPPPPTCTGPCGGPAPPLAPTTTAAPTTTPGAAPTPGGP